MRERAGRDGNGNFVGISCDEESPVAPVGSSAVNKDEGASASIGTQEEELAEQVEEHDMN